MYLLRGTLSSLLGHLSNNEYSSEWIPKQRNSDFAGLMIAEFLDRQNSVKIQRIVIVSSILSRRMNSKAYGFQFFKVKRVFPNLIFHVALCGNLIQSVALQ